MLILTEDLLSRIRNNSQEIFKIEDLDISIYSSSLRISLNHSKNKLDTEDIQRLTEALSQNQTMEDLNLPSNQIGDQGVYYLAQVLKKHPKLRKIGLSGNELTAEGIKHIAEALKENTTVQELDIRSNRGGPLGAKYIADMLRQNKSLKRVDMGVMGSCETIGDEGACYLADALKFNKTLLKLNVSGHDIGAKGIKALIDVLASHNRTLLRLELDTPKDETAYGYLANGPSLLARDQGVLRSITCNIKRRQAFEFPYRGMNDADFAVLFDVVDMQKIPCKKIKIQSGNYITDKTLQTLSRITSLEEVEIDSRSSSPPERAILALLELPYLQVLKIECYILTISPNLADALARKASLRHLELKCKIQGDVVIQNIAKSTTITRLSLKTTPAVNATGAKAISRMPQLEILYLTSQKIDAEGAIALSDMPALTELYISSDKKVGDEAARLLARSTRLKKLSLSRCGITDEGAVSFTFNKVLEFLYIANNYINQQTMDSIAERIKLNRQNNHRLMAQKLFNEQDYLQALPLWQKIVAEQPQDTEAKYLLGLSYEQIEQYQAAIDSLQTITSDKQFPVFESLLRIHQKMYQQQRNLWQTERQDLQQALQMQQAQNDQLRQQLGQQQLALEEARQRLTELQDTCQEGEEQLRQRDETIEQLEQELNLLRAQPRALPTQLAKECRNRVSELLYQSQPDLSQCNTLIDYLNESPPEALQGLAFFGPMAELFAENRNLLQLKGLIFDVSQLVEEIENIIKDYKSKDKLKVKHLMVGLDYLKYQLQNKDILPILPPEILSLALKHRAVKWVDDPNAIDIPAEFKRAIESCAENKIDCLKDLYIEGGGILDREFTTQMDTYVLNLVEKYSSKYRLDINKELALAMFKTRELENSYKKLAKYITGKIMSSDNAPFITKQQYTHAIEEVILQENFKLEPHLQTELLEEFFQYLRLLDNQLKQCLGKKPSSFFFQARHTQEILPDATPTTVQQLRHGL